MIINRDTSPQEIRTAFNDFKAQATGEQPYPQHPGIIDTSWRVDGAQDPSTWEPRRRTTPSVYMQGVMLEDPEFFRKPEGRFLAILDQTIIE